MENRPRDQLQCCFENWINQQQKDLVELSEILRDDEARNDEDKLLSMTQKNIEHFQDYLEKRLVLLRDDPPSMFTPAWCTPFENSLLWISGCRPTLAIQLVYTLCGSELEAHLNEFLRGVRRGHMGELSASQLGLLNELHVITVREEEKLSDRLARLQEDIGEHQLGLLMIEGGGCCGNGSSLSSSSSSSSKTSDGVGDSNGCAKMNGCDGESEDGDQHDSELGCILGEADRLRLETLKELIRILSPLQAADFLVAAKKIYLSMHVWGTKRRDSSPERSGRNPHEFSFELI